MLTRPPSTLPAADHTKLMRLRVCTLRNECMYSYKKGVAWCYLTDSRLAVVPSDAGCHGTVDITFFFIMCDE